MIFDFFRKNILGRFSQSAGGTSETLNRYHLYSSASPSYPAMRFPSQKQAMKASKKIFEGSHCRVVDTETGSATTVGVDVCAFLPDSFLAGINITQKISACPQFINDLHARIPDLTRKNYCWSNSFLTILNLFKKHPDLRYALTLIYHPAVGVEGHAIIEHNGQFYDPTLERHAVIQGQTSYRLLEVIEMYELIRRINEHYGPDGFREMANSAREWPNFRVSSSGDRIFDL